MATVKAKPKVKAGKLDVKGALTRKFGPLPAWAYLLLVGGLVYYWRHRASSTGATATSTTAADTSGAGSTAYPGDNGSGSGGGAGAGSPDSGSGTPVIQIPSSTNDGGGTGSTPAATGPGTAPGGVLNPNILDAIHAQGGYGTVPGGGAVAKAPAAPKQVSKADLQKAVDAAAGVGAPRSKAAPEIVSDAASGGGYGTSTKAKATSSDPFGGVKSTVTKGGVTTTTYGNGRVVQQRAGKSAYVAKKGG